MVNIEFVEMGTASSIHGRSHENNTAEERTFGDRVELEVTRNLPVENLGIDDAQPKKEDVKNTTETSYKSISVRSLFTNRSSTIERTRSDNAADIAEVAELKLQRVIQLKSALEQENDRLKSELRSLRSGLSKWRNACDKASQDEKQALLRAESMEKGIKHKFCLIAVLTSN